MFVGTYERSLDDKGRLVLPSQFRNSLAGPSFLSRHGRALSLSPAADFEASVGRLQQSIRDGDDSPDELRRFAATTHEVNLDGQGRIIVPAKLRESAGIDREVAVIGMVTRIEIWDVDRFATLEAQGDENSNGRWL